ncbi:MAG: septal ring lytic transglycosylase RlpA family protein [Nitrospiraceae bacterium]|nr:septal ring lytic transglycosylase RlpA family protein [Nitrospiraceae bacterium]
MKTSAGIFCRCLFRGICLALLLASCTTTHRSPDAGYPGDRIYAVASWYGADFNGRPTASGEVFNMYANTCAHRQYPFGTRLKVTHLSNGRTAECIVNDRGPFIEGRDIDLSYAVAKEIGVIGPGTSKVLLEVTGRDRSYIRQVKVQSPDRKGQFVIQVGAFTDMMNAVRLKAALGLKYDNVTIEETDLRGTVFHRVRLGTFKSFSRAYGVAEELGQEGYQPIIVKSGLKV